jgi:hypothetical protein
MMLIATFLGDNCFDQNPETSTVTTALGID